MVPISWKFTGKPWDLNSLPLTPDQVWAKLDLPPEEVRASLNVLIGILNSVTAGSSGAKNVAMTAIPAIGVQADVQTIVEALITRLQAVTASLSGAKFIGAETISGLTGNDVQTLLVALKTLTDGYNTAQTGALTTHKTSADHNGTYFTETELGASTGAGLVGATAPSGLTGTTTQALINALKTAIDDAILGGIVDGSLTNIKFATDVKVGSLATLTTVDKTSVTNAVNEIATNVISHLADVVTVATANKILKLDANAKLPASITGDSATVGGKSASDLGVGTWEKIAEQTLVSTAAQVDFASIPSGYKNLRLTFEARSGVDASSSLVLVLNADVSANYRYQKISGNSTSVSTSGYADQQNIPLMDALPASSATYSYGIIKISNFNPLRTKVINGEWYAERGITPTTLYKYFIGGIWANSLDEINKISLSGSNGIGTGSRFVLWGCK